MEELGRLEERVILIGVQTAAEDNVLDSLDELEELAETAGAVTVGRIIQNREAVQMCIRDSIISVYLRW